MRKDYGTLWCEKWYKHHPVPKTEAKEVDILKDFAIQTDSKIKSNRPDIMIKDYKKLR